MVAGVSKRTICLLIFACVQTLCVSAELPDLLLARYTDAYDLFLNGEIDSQTLESALDGFLLAAKNQSDSGELLYWKAKCRFLQALFEIYHGTKSEAENHLKSVLEIVSTLGEYNQEQAFAIEAEARSQLMRIGGVFAIVRSAGLVEDLANKALEINPFNVRARLLLAQGKINAPRIFGGKPEYAVELLNEIVNLNRSEEFLSIQDLFWYQYTLGTAFEKLKKQNLARKAYEYAMELYPGNKMVRDHLSDL